MKLQIQTAVKLEPQYGPATIDAHLETEATAHRMGDVGELARLSAASLMQWLRLKADRNIEGTVAG
jgi:hypothetical protein